MRDLTRRELLSAAAGTLVGACADGTAPGPDAGDDAADASPDVSPDAPPKLDAAPRDVAPDVSPDAPSVRDAALDARPDVVADVGLDARPDARVDVGPDAAPDMPPPCGLSDRYLASLPVAAVPARGGVLDPELRVVVARDGRGVYAFSAVCPHFGCVVEVATGASTVCPCHGSTFDDDGARLRGPATRSLLNHPIAFCEGRVYVDRSRSVPVGTRTPLT